MHSRELTGVLRIPSHVAENRLPPVRLWCLQEYGTTVQQSLLLARMNLSSSVCAVGYTGVACRDCGQPGFYRLGDVCRPCPKAAYGAVSLVVLAIGKS